jgi:hypothetical protein
MITDQQTKPKTPDLHHINQKDSSPFGSPSPINNAQAAPC